MTEARHSLRLVHKAVLSELQAAALQRRPGAPKPLRGQAQRLLHCLNTDASRRHYRSAQVLLLAALLLWAVVPLLPQAAPPLDMKAVRACLYITVLLSMCAALLQAIVMDRSNKRAFREI